MPACEAAAVKLSCSAARQKSSMLPSITSPNCRFMDYAVEEVKCEAGSLSTRRSCIPFGLPTATFRRKSMTSRIAIVHHSGYGHTRKIAEAVAQGSGGALLAIDDHGE